MASRRLGMRLNTLAFTVYGLKGETWPAAISLYPLT